MSLCCKWGGKLLNRPLKINKWGHFKYSKWSRQKIETFRGAQDFFGPLNGTSNSKDHFGGKKVSGPSKSLDFVPGPFRILDMAPYCDFQRVYFIISRHIYSTVTLVILCHLFYSFWGLFLFLVFHTCTFTAGPYQTRVIVFLLIIEFKGILVK